VWVITNQSYVTRHRTWLPNINFDYFSQSLLDEVKKNSRAFISMKDDWKQVFGLEP
jgi:hypothetical protein